LSVIAYKRARLDRDVLSKDQLCPYDNHGYLSPRLRLSFLAICIYINITFTDNPLLVSSPPLREECATVRAELLDVAEAFNEMLSIQSPLHHDEA
jgi:hypothetical protein